MTPQTLFNDLKTENCDIRDIVLLVIGMSPLPEHGALIQSPTIYDI